MYNDVYKLKRPYIMAISSYFKGGWKPAEVYDSRYNVHVLCSCKVMNFYKFPVIRLYLSEFQVVVV